MRIYRVLGLIGVASFLVWFIVVLIVDVVEDGGRGLNQPMFWVFLILLGLILCNFVPVTKADDDSLLSLWVKVKKEKLKKEIEETKEKLRKEINND